MIKNFLKWSFAILLVAFVGSAIIAGIIDGIKGDSNQPEASINIPPSSNDITENTPPEEGSSLDSPSSEDSNKEEITNIKKIAPLEITLIEYSQDFLGGNELRLSTKNLTQREIKWIEFTFSFLNLKDELLKDEIRGWVSIKWLDGPIKPGERIEGLYGTFYNPQFKGKAILTELTIQYSSGEKEYIYMNDFLSYENIYFVSGDNIVWYSEYSASYHTENCEYRALNHCNLGNTIYEAKKLGKVRCSFCKPY